MRTVDELTLSKDLISFPSITPVDAGAINFLAKKLRSLGFKCQSSEDHIPRPSIYRFNQGLLLFSCPLHL